MTNVVTMHGENIDIYSMPSSQSSFNYSYKFSENVERNRNEMPIKIKYKYKKQQFIHNVTGGGSKTKTTL